jgi:hypothetical protein
MFIGGVWLGVFAGLCKMAALDPRTMRSTATFYEMVEYRRRGLSVGEAAPDGYVHRWLDAGLKDAGLDVPSSWSRFADKDGGNHQ